MSPSVSNDASNKYSVTMDEVCRSAHGMSEGTNPETGPLVGQIGETLFPGGETIEHVPFPKIWKTGHHLFSIQSCIAYSDEFGQKLETRSCYIVMEQSDKAGIEIHPCANGNDAR